ncbi:hypothetical protein [Rhizobium sp. Root1220]|uniref:hypothetical protein n=1 Tax=Rhizobium sp. Root1220 TaxID=1736432 RepID=UPI0006F703F3|nr:hypothetical protein [Rhizobium sp. Root1220]KQV63747.1 hypothetical protein ASC90_17335 [Rhizobium sp. Root1220]
MLNNINLERSVLFFVGLVFLLFALAKVWVDSVTAAGGVALIGIMCLAFSNLARFKKFKGLGFEAELWEEKQQEAADLIDLFKTYTNEIVMGSVMSGRMGGNGAEWGSRWKLFNDLTGSKPVPGATFDFSDLRKRVEDVFLFDMCLKMSDAIRLPLSKGRQEAAKIIAEEFESPIKDVESYSARVRQNDIPEKLVGSFEIAKSENLARKMLELADQSSETLRERFGVVVEFDASPMSRLQKIADLADKRPLKITDELIQWANHR